MGVYGTYHNNRESAKTDGECCDEENSKQYWAEHVFHCMHVTEEL